MPLHSPVMPELHTGHVRLIGTISTHSPLQAVETQDGVSYKSKFSMRSDPCVDPEILLHPNKRMC